MPKLDPNAVETAETPPVDPTSETPPTAETPAGLAQVHETLTAALAHVEALQSGVEPVHPYPREAAVIAEREQHPDEALPRAETFIHERDNWAAEAENLRTHLVAREKQVKEMEGQLGTTPVARLRSALHGVLAPQIGADHTPADTDQVLIRLGATAQYSMDYPENLARALMSIAADIQQERGS